MGLVLSKLSMVQAVKGYDPAFGYEMAAIIENGVKEMWGEDLISRQMSKLAMML